MNGKYTEKQVLDEMKTALCIYTNFKHTWKVSGKRLSTCLYCQQLKVRKTDCAYLTVTILYICRGIYYEQS